MPPHRSRLIPLVASLALCLPIASSALAQATAPKAPPASAAQDPETLKVAREVVGQMQGDRAATLNGMATPMVGMMRGMGVQDPDRAEAIIREAVLPLLVAHYDELLDIQAQNFAKILTKEDLRAIGAFYATPAGRRLAAAQPQLAQAQMTGTTQWIQGLMPEMQAKIIQLVKASGKGPSDKAK